MLPVTTTLVALWLGCALASGVRFYATVALLGWMVRMGAAPELLSSMSVLGATVIVAGATLMACLEFFADKARQADSLWDALHTFIRSPGGALLSFMALDGHSLAVRMGAAAIGGSLAFAAHSTKASVRFAANASQHRNSNLGLSAMEDVLTVVVVYLAVFQPVWSLGFVFVSLVTMGLVLPRVFFAFVRALSRALDRYLAKGP